MTKGLRNSGGRVPKRKRVFLPLPDVEGGVPDDDVVFQFDDEIEMVVQFFGNPLVQEAIMEAYPKQRKRRYFDKSWASYFNAAGSQWHHYVRDTEWQDVPTDTEMPEDDGSGPYVDLRIDSTIHSPYRQDIHLSHDLSKHVPRELDFRAAGDESAWKGKHKRPMTMPICTQTAKLDPADNLCQTYALANFINPLDRLVTVTDETTGAITNPHDKLIKLSGYWVEVLNNEDFLGAMERENRWDILLNTASVESMYLRPMTETEIYAFGEQILGDEDLQKYRKKGEKKAAFEKRMLDERFDANIYPQMPDPSGNMVPSSDLRLYREPWDENKTRTVKRGNKYIVLPNRYNVDAVSRVTPQAFLEQLKAIVEQFRAWGYRRYIGKGNVHATHFMQRTVQDANFRKEPLPEYKPPKARKRKKTQYR